MRTASSEQVRQPIFREGVDHWRHYEPWLGPLKAALGPVLESYPDSTGVPVSKDKSRTTEQPLEREVTQMKRHDTKRGGRRIPSTFARLPLAAAIYLAVGSAAFAQEAAPAPAAAEEHRGGDPRTRSR